jgi:hypothetical protein
MKLRIGRKKKVRESQCTSVAFADHFSSIIKSSSLSFQITFILLRLFLNIPSISDSDVKHATRHLSSSKCIDPDEIPGFIIKSCSQTFAAFLCHTF